MLSVEGLHARVGRHFALRDLTLRAVPGEVLAVLGPSGSGKSTLLRLLAGLEAPTEGLIAWSGEPLSRGRQVLVPPERRGMGLLFQEGVLFPTLDVRRNVALGLASGERDGAARVEQALRLAQAEHLADRPAPELSGGEQQRVALARLLAQRPRVMLLDEPFHSLDDPLRQAVAREVRAAVQAQGIAAILVTHDAWEAATFADRLLLLRDGAAVQQGTMQEVYRSPCSRWAAEFLGPVQTLSVQDARAFGVELPPETLGERVHFRPEDVALELIPEGQAGGLVVREVRALGALGAATLALTDGQGLVSYSLAPQAPAQGQRVRARILRRLPDFPEEGRSP